MTLSRQQTIYLGQELCTGTSIRLLNVDVASETAGSMQSITKISAKRWFYLYIGALQVDIATLRSPGHGSVLTTAEAAKGY
jgi:hypothetical protein